jgi:hypothetical protein
MIRTRSSAAPVSSPARFSRTAPPFNTTAPEGNRVGVLFNSQGRDTGEYGFH